MNRGFAMPAALATSLAALGGYGGTVAGRSGPAEATDRTNLTFFVRDASQLAVDLGSKGPGHGDLFTYHGKVFTEKDGKRLGRFGGTCTTLGRSAGVPEDATCNLDYILPGGQLFTRTVTAQLFSGKPVAMAVLGGTGAYRTARGDGTIRVPTDVEDQTDGYVVLNLR